MNGDDGGGVLGGPHHETLGYPHLSLVDAALIDGARPQDAMLGVQQHHPQLLLLQRRHLDAEQVGYVLRRADWGPVLQRERSQAPSQLQRRLEAHGLGIAQPPSAAPAPLLLGATAREVRRGPPATAARSELRSPADASVENEGEKLPIAQRH